MKKLIHVLEKCLKNHEDCVLATIVEQSGSTPRGAGAAMIVTSKGRICGTVGGGAIEYKSECVAKELITLKESRLDHFYLKPNQVQDLGMVCGGDVTIYFQFISSNRKENMELVQYIKNKYDKEEQFWLIQEITSHSEDTWSVFSKEEGEKGGNIPSEVIDNLRDKPYQQKVGEKVYFSVPLQSMSKVYIFGGGHVSQALVPVLSTVGFHCIVLEDREEFCRPELFPTAEKLMLIDISKISEYIEIKEKDFVCIMTRGHKDDMEVQAQVLNTPAYYIGVIGSRKKKATVFAKLKERGFTDGDLSRVTTPIGIDIKAETPAEIAVSITAQMIEKRAEMINHA